MASSPTQSTTESAQPPRKRRRLRRVLALGIGLVFAMIAFEIACVVMVHAGLVSARTPTYSFERTARAFWGDLDENFGVWHYPNIKFRHTKACFDVTYETNSYGARDVERPFRSEKARFLVLGDSFMEGFGVDLGERMSDQLEAETGLPHLNFGVAGNAGPTHAFKLYESLGSRFDHTGVIAAILPENDFEDDERRPGRYLPYWVGEYPDYELKYGTGNLRKSAWSEQHDLEDWSLRRVLHDFTYSKNVIDLLYTSFKYSRTAGKRRGDIELPESRFFDYTQEQFDRMRYSYERLAALAAPRPLVLFTIPRYADLRAYVEQGEAPLDDALAEWARGIDNVFFVPLLPDLIARHGENWEDLFLRCDPHWGATGHRLAAEILKQRVGDILYGE